MDPMRTLIATEDNTIVTVPNQVRAACVCCFTMTRGSAACAQNDYSLVVSLIPVCWFYNQVRPAPSRPQLVALCVVVNRSRAPHWTVGATSPLLSNPRELRFRMKLPHAALDKFKVSAAGRTCACRDAHPETLHRRKLSPRVAVTKAAHLHSVVRFVIACQCDGVPKTVPDRTKAEAPLP